MRVTLSKLDPGTTRVELDWPAKTLGRLDKIPGQTGHDEAGIRVVGPVAGWVEITPVGDELKVEGRVATRLALACHRCLEEVVKSKEVEFDLTLVESFGLSQSDRELAAEEMDLALIEGEKLDLVEVIREQLLLSCEMINLCRPNCRGLCSRCGANLNNSPCECQLTETDPRLAVLSQWQPSSD
ncbi:MAG: DUF177 domain-containing protein [Deltaproteobacteria bacterium]|nr:DUF177 domain-containing protein [Deltaproteobacteria bacterium]